ncbi:hypothetical protein Ddye_008833 [Dipteronia dyeriana]|uniref:Reverse transcriptase domain-containing protein n=1 Tax=Dipteronia dyeriana TaxID=168575 RepID=A0AAE0CLR1_9ROSI|nr:hypothetical protein Ddye_008833 [Dipteronia dyeriana]
MFGPWLKAFIPIKPNHFSRAYKSGQVNSSMRNSWGEAPSTRDLAATDHVSNKGKDMLRACHGTVPKEMQMDYGENVLGSKHDTPDRLSPSGSPMDVGVKAIGLKARKAIQSLVKNIIPGHFSTDYIVWRMFRGYAREALDDCGLQNISFMRPLFTWYNKLKGPNMAQERLNSCVFVGELVTNVCLGVHNDGNSLEEVNATFITLIPKLKRAERATDFWNVSLCNVVYKFFAKSLTNRFRKVLGDMISDTQSAFIPGRLIIDYAIVGFECLHALKRGRKGLRGAMAFKLDMSKAYDRVKWSLLSEMMSRLILLMAWIDQIMRCVTSVSFSFLINGLVRGWLKPTRRFR